MMLDIIFLAIIGVFAGVITGLLPGWHPNAMAAVILSFSPVLLMFFSPHAVAVCIISTAITHTFLSFVPSVYLGAPDESSTVLSVLPGHRFLSKGKGYEAVYLTVVGGIGVILLSIVLFPLIFLLLPVLYANIKNYIAFILIVVLLLMVLTERGFKKINGLLVFALSGILGLIVFNSPIFSGSNILFPIFTGLFGVSTLIISYLSKFKIPKQRIEKVSIPRETSFNGITKGFFSGLIVAILPGIGAAQAAVLVHQLTKKSNIKEFLISLGGINTVAALFSLMALYLIAKPRSGAAVAVERILGTFGFNDLLLLIATAVFASGIASIVTLKLTRCFSSFIQRFDYRKISLGIVTFLTILVLIFNGIYGLLLLFTSTAIGLLPPLLGVKRTHGMGVLMLPIMLWYLGLSVYLF
jgi:putative membrane protein